MKDLMIEPVLDPVSEARRYVENAEKTLSENGKYDPETNCYQDPKYVRAAGHYLWSSVLIILDAVFKIKTKQRPHPDVKDYRNAIFKRDKNCLPWSTPHIS